MTVAVEIWAVASVEIWWAEVAEIWLAKGLVRLGGRPNFGHRTNIFPVEPKLGGDENLLDHGGPEASTRFCDKNGSHLPIVFQMWPKKGMLNLQANRL